MKRFLFLILLLFSYQLSAAEALTLDDLLKQAKQNLQASQQINAQREQQFLAEKKLQQKKLKRAKADLKQTEKTSAKLKKLYDQNEKKIAELKKRLEDRSATMGEVFGAVRQVANDASGLLHNSMISPQLGDRQTLLEKLAKSKALPSITELEKMWLGLLEEMTEAGKVVQYPAAVITADGSESQKTVTRVGSFNSFSDGKYLRYLPESQRLVELARQPKARYQEMAHELESNPAALTTIGVDSSRGAILSAIVQTPSLQERIAQGGVIGYIILAIGALALLIGLERWLVLLFTGLKVNKQLKQTDPDSNNPLGRILSVSKKISTHDVETLQLKLDEAILKELPKIERGLSTIAIMAAIAPLLGLLGTVTGMIETFTSITLFGTGDPKYMSSGISQALVTTELGLAVAIPVILFHSYLTSHGNRLIQILDEQSAGLIAMSAEQKSAGPASH
ncbi:MAG: MotA/TolQ/ExbB proton channel family protein [Gammaproteobacteria bacterium]|nr:MotA/TolQ/ExbB proton channel family protein [Gammaproteobacteria bacterium]